MHVGIWRSQTDGCNSIDKPLIVAIMARHAAVAPSRAVAGPDYGRDMGKILC